MDVVGLPIESVQLRICYNSRGQECLEADAIIRGKMGRAASPAGASVGKAEAVAFPKGGPQEALKLFREYSSKLVGVDVSDVKSFTNLLRSIDGTENCGRIGGSAAYAVSVAAADAAAKVTGKPLYALLNPFGPHTIPYPLGNVLGGGAHAGKGSPDIQEFLVCPVGAKNIRDALKANLLVHREIRKEIEQRDPTFPGGKGDEGAWAPKMVDDEALDVVSAAVGSVSRTLGFEIRMGLDMASSSLWKEDQREYVYARSGVVRSPDKQLEYAMEVARKYNLIYLEDPLHEEAFDAFALLTSKLNGIFVTGDDLFVTNASRLKRGAALNASNAAILKVNQAGGLGDALEFYETALRLGYSLITSHRSGDTCDAHIAHVAVATGSKMIKTGVVGGERVVKLNELIRISESDALPMADLKV